VVDIRWVTEWSRRRGGGGADGRGGLDGVLRRKGGRGREGGERVETGKWGEKRWEKGGGGGGGMGVGVESWREEGVVGGEEEAIAGARWSRGWGGVVDLGGG